MQKIILTENVPLDLQLTLRRFIAYGEDAANYFDGKIFRKVLRFNGQLRLLQLTREENAVEWCLFPAENNSQILQAAGKIVRHILGLDFDLPAFYSMVGTDPVFEQLIDRFYGLRPTLTADPFEMLVTSISAQQINLAFAFTVRSRLICEYGSCFTHNGRDYFAFPTPAALTSIDPQALRALQFTRRKTEYIIGLAQAIASGSLDLPSLQQSASDEIERCLTAIRGIGVWTVDWFLARGLGRPDAFPAGDLAVRKAMQNHYFNGEKTEEKSIRSRAAIWGEFANLACHYLLAGFTIQ